MRNGAKLWDPFLRLPRNDGSGAQSALPSFRRLNLHQILLMFDFSLELSAQLAQLLELSFPSDFSYVRFHRARPGLRLVSCKQQTERSDALCACIHPKFQFEATNNCSQMLTFSSQFSYRKPLASARHHPAAFRIIGNRMKSELRSLIAV